MPPGCCSPCTHTTACTEYSSMARRDAVLGEDARDRGQLATREGEVDAAAVAKRFAKLDVRAHDVDGRQLLRQEREA